MSKVTHKEDDTSIVRTETTSTYASVSVTDKSTGESARSESWSIFGNMRPVPQQAFALLYCMNESQKTRYQPPCGTSRHRDELPGVHGLGT